MTGVNFIVEETTRREGDPPILVADSSKIAHALNWKPQYNDLKLICKTAWDWELNRNKQ